MPPMSSLRLALTKLWTRDSSILLGGFFVTVLLILYVWWPLAEEYFAYVDWSVFVGLCGGLAIESWGTQTNLWHYYTAERPPLWIVPAWPIASLSIDRITRGLSFLTIKVTKQHKGDFFFVILYWLTFASFMGLMLVFVAPTFDKSYTGLALLLCILLIFTPTDYRFALLTFIAGAGLGYSLELWGTTRQCWTYYTY
jgi:hypothetical protein